MAAPRGRPQHEAPAHNDQPAYGSDPAPHGQNGYQEAHQEPHYASDPAPQHYSQDTGYDAAQPTDFDAAPRRSAADFPPRYADERLPPADWHNGAAAAPSYPSLDQYHFPSTPQAAPPPLTRSFDPSTPFGGAPYPSQSPAAPPFAEPHYAEPLARPASADNYPPARAAFEPPSYPAAPDRQGQSAPLYPQVPEAGSMPPPHDDEFYDDAPRGRRRGLMTVLVVLGLAAVGSAGAFGYRSLFGGPGAASMPPVIRASGEPSKVAPPPAPDQAAGKFSYDRFGDAGKDEQIVRRAETPLDLTRTAASRTVLPGAPVPSAPSDKAAGTANPPSAIGEPRRVRTVPIRPDQPDLAGMPSAVADSMAPPRQAYAAPSDSSRLADLAAQQSSSTRAPVRAAARPAPAAAMQTAPSGANAPLSLSPDANNAPPVQDIAPAPPPVRQAAAPAPVRVASAPASGGGGYLVQVTSQRSEADAESAYRGIQSKYSSVLGSQRHEIRRADLGAKGVYYRAMVGPFGSRESAVQLCTSLKQAGGDCVVAH